MVCGWGGRRQEWLWVGWGAWGWWARVWRSVSITLGDGCCVARNDKDTTGYAKGWAGRQHTPPSLQLFLRLVSLALGRKLYSMRASLTQLLISCWKELGINMASELWLKFWLRFWKVAYPWMRGKFIPDGECEWYECICVYTCVCIYM